LEEEYLTMDLKVLEDITLNVKMFKSVFE